MPSFNPDKFLAETAPKSSGFDPDKFLAETEKNQEPIFGEGGTVPKYLEEHPNLKSLVSGSIEALPVAGGVLGAMGGGLLGGVETAATGGLAAPATPTQMIAGGGLGSALGESAAIPLRTYILGEKPKGLLESGVDVAGAGMLGSAGELAGQGLALAGKSGIELAKKTPGLISKGLTKLVGLEPEAMVAGVRGLDQELAQKQAVESAGDALGIKPTRGMLTTDLTTRGLESSLEQAPTVAGKIVRSEVEPVRRAMSDFVDESTKSKSMKSPVVIGENIKDGIKDKILRTYEPIKAIYADFEKNAINIPLKEKSQLAIARNLNQYADEMLTTTDKQMVKDYADNILSAKNVNQLKDLRSQVIAKINSGENPQALGLVVEKLDRAIKGTTIRAALEVAQQSGTKGAMRAGIEEEGKSLIRSWKGVNSDYRELMTALGGFAKESKVANKIFGPMDLLKKIDSIPSEQLADKLFTESNVKALRQVKKLFPQEFEMIRSKQLADIYSSTLEKTPMGTETASATKFIKEINKYTPEIRAELFGPEFKGEITHDKAFAAMETLVNSFPSKVGPSGTPQGIGFVNIFHPKEELKDYIRMQQYRGNQASPLKVAPEQASPGLLNRGLMQQYFQNKNQ